MAFRFYSFDGNPDLSIYGVPVLFLRRRAGFIPLVSFPFNPFGGVPDLFIRRHSCLFLRWKSDVFLSWHSVYSVDGISIYLQDGTPVYSFGGIPDSSICGIPVYSFGGIPDSSICGIPVFAGRQSSDLILMWRSCSFIRWDSRFSLNGNPVSPRRYSGFISYEAFPIIP